jgi:hypothetical protein
LPRQRSPRTLRNSTATGQGHLNLTSSSVHVSLSDGRNRATVVCMRSRLLGTGAQQLDRDCHTYCPADAQHWATGRRKDRHMTVGRQLKPA